MIPDWVRWLVLASGIVIVVVAWSASDSGFRMRLRKWKKPVDHYEYDDGLHGYRGGIARFKFLLLGLALILIAIFWSKLRPHLDWLVAG
ncbi:MAG: hypothetical protein A3G25_11245 [Betaproteobacteria bacterium RIFCSPLOWO2_12_FULL_63_13]|nr:MAG: hypothetical protein A3G25_11245 [Betaproteobacteria bacterium RIFCSPLOWO2_12_FULL_63_13]